MAITGQNTRQTHDLKIDDFIRIQFPFPHFQSASNIVAADAARFSSTEGPSEFRRDSLRNPKLFVWSISTSG